MRITADKLDGKPEHGVSPAELREALRRLPPQWTEDMESVRLSSSMKSWDVAAFSTVTKRLVLCSRGRKKEEVIRAMIRELFLHSDRTHATPEWRLSPKQKAELDVKLDAHFRAVTEEEPNQSPEPTRGTGVVLLCKTRRPRAAQL